MRGLVIWAHSKCRSTFDLYREVMRQSLVPVRLAFWQGTLEQRVGQGFSTEDFDVVPSVLVGDDWMIAERLLSETVGWTHVVAAYQVSGVFQRVMSVAKSRGDHVVVFSEAPCEMCLGGKGLLKRLYYRFVLPWKLHAVVRNAESILNQSGSMGIDRLMRLGWRREQIIPFGYASGPLPRQDALDALEVNGVPSSDATETSHLGALRVLHLGSEAPYRGVKILDEAVALARNRGAELELLKTGGRISLDELVSAIRSADVIVACGLCEPWGMRINDAVLEGKPVIVSDGMGVAYMVNQEGCGLVVPQGDPAALALALERCAHDREFLGRLRTCAQQAAQHWSPASRARVFLEHIGVRGGLNAER